MPGAGAAAGGLFGGNTQQLTQALTYVKAHGGGTLGVGSQQGASSAVIAGKDVAGIGGFSGRESEVTASWLAQAVSAGKIRWVLTDSSGSGGGMPNDSRVGDRSVMSAVQQTCTAVSSVDGLFNCQGAGAALAAQSYSTRRQPPRPPASLPRAGARRPRSQSSQESHRLLRHHHRMEANRNGDGAARVLVVDDEPNIADVITMALRYQGFDDRGRRHRPRRAEGRRATSDRT